MLCSTPCLTVRMRTSDFDLTWYDRKENLVPLVGILGSDYEEQRGKEEDRLKELQSLSVFVRFLP